MPTAAKALCTLESRFKLFRTGNTHSKLVTCFDLHPFAKPLDGGGGFAVEGCSELALSSLIRKTSSRLYDERRLRLSRRARRCSWRHSSGTGSGWNKNNNKWHKTQITLILHPREGINLKINLFRDYIQSSSLQARYYSVKWSRALTVTDICFTTTMKRRVGKHSLFAKIHSNCSLCEQMCFHLHVH